MAEFFKTSTIWVIDFLYDGRPRRWFRAGPAGADLPSQVLVELAEAYGDRARVVEARVATAEEEGQYLRGEVPATIYCPTGR
jgi:hypothetical protein